MLRQALSWKAIDHHCIIFYIIINVIKFLVVFTLGRMINISMSGTGKGGFHGQMKQLERQDYF